jgi:thiamine-phosphate pyrophosphorylase
LLLYYITDRTQFPGGEDERRERLLEKIAEAARAGMDFVQFREKDLCARDLELLAREAVTRVRNFSSTTRLMINSRTDIALAVGADGVHLRSSDVSAADVRKIWHAANGPGEPLVSVSCHSAADVLACEEARADFAIFAPVFGKEGRPQKPAGLDMLRVACGHRVSVLALGGVTVENAHLCTEAGAAGVAGIRLFQKGDIEEIVTKLRG